MRIRTLSFIGVLGIAALLGYIAGRRSASPSQGQDTKSTPSIAQAPSPSVRFTSHKSTASEIKIRQLARQRDNPHSQARLLQLADEIPLAEIPELLRRLENSTVIHEIAPFVTRLAHRWAAAHPESPLAIADSLTKTEWKNLVTAGALSGLAERDPEAAIAHAQKSSLPKLDLWRGLLSTIAESDPARAHALAAEHLSPADLQQVRWDLLRTWADQDPEAALVAARSLPGRAERDQTIADILSSLSPEEGWTALQSTTNRLTRAYALPAYFTRLASENPQLALEKLNTLPPRERALATESFGLAWAQADAKAAFDWVQTFSHKDALPSLTHQIFAAYAQAHPDKIHEAISAAAPENRVLLLEASIDALSASNPEKAITLVNQLPDTGRAQAQSRLIAGLSASDPAKAAAILANMANPDPYLFDSIGMQWAGHDPQQALAWAKNLPEGESRSLAISAVLSGLATADPALASTAIEEIPSHETRSRAVNAVLLQWSQSDPDAALAWAQSLKDDSLKQQALRSLTAQFTESRPDEAIRFAQNLPPGDREQAVHTAARLWTQHDPAGALNWAKSITDQETLNAAVPALVSGLAERSPQAAANFVATLPASPVQSEALRNVVLRWSVKEPAAVSQWVEQFPESDLRAEAASELVANWSQLDSEQAGKWLQKLPESPSRQKAVLTYIDNAYYSRPAQAAPWVSSITDPSKRQAAIEQIYNRWQNLDQKAASTWLKTLPDR